MSIYVPHGNYRLFEFAGRFYSNANVQITETAEGADIRFARYSSSTGEPIYAGSMRLTGDNIQVSNGEIVSGTISSIQFFAFNFEYFAGELQGLNWNGYYFQTLLHHSSSADFSPFYNTLTGAVQVVRGDEDWSLFENSEDYAATDIHLGGGDDSYAHPRFTVMPASTIDGGEGHDRFYAGRTGPVLVDVDNEIFVDFNGTEHTVRNFEFFQGSERDDRLIGAMNRSNSLHGDQGSDYVSGGNQADYLSGGWGIDTINAYGGDDRIVASMADIVDGGDGIDTYAFRLGATGSVYIDMENSADNSGYALGTTLVNVENLGGSDWYDTMLGDSGDNVIETFDRRDVLHGRGGNDTLDGGSGDDQIAGGEGRNLLIGGLGADTFAFETLNARDTIADFEVGIDQLDFRTLNAQAGQATLEFDGHFVSRTSCFGTPEFEDFVYSLVQSDDGVEVFLSTRKTTGATAPIVTLSGIDLEDLSIYDFVF